ncbi:ImmA/IrrE family metallo-endopeptidase [Microvirga subterranea]|nr:ImmA/IrrE family metallo-endopeptidase [Microvirga subterranea]
MHDFAEKSAERLGFRPGDPIEPLVAKLRGHINLRSPTFADDEVPESIRVAPDGTFQIFVSSMTSAERNRFTIAHELGHLLLHFPLIKRIDEGAGMVATRWVDENDPNQKRAEWEANWFAAAFLMPATAFQQALATRGSLKSVANFFGVSARAAEVRLETLGSAELI